jgi:hypothetical protein
VTSPFAAALLLGVAAVTACGSGGGPVPLAVAGAGEAPLDAYRHQLAALAPSETAALAALAAHTGAKYTDDAALLEALRSTALPRYREFVTGLERLQPQEAARPLHERLLAAARAELGLLEKLEAAVTRADGTAVLMLNQEQRRLRAELDGLAASAGEAGVQARARPPSGR